MMANLAEELLLLAFHDQTGRNQATNLELGLAGAIVLELALAERIDVVDKRVRVVDATPTGDGLVDSMLQRLADDKPRRAQSVVQRLSRGLVQQVRDGLVRSGVLRHDRDTVLGLFPFNRYVATADNRIEVDAVRRLSTAIDTGHTRDQRTSALASLVYILQLEKKVFPDRRKRDVRAALKQLSEASWASRATKQAVDAAMAAAMAAVTAAAASSAAASSN